MEKKIQDFIDQIEKKHQIQIKYAIESGSRAWGFPSPDSDYDIRFVYCKPTNAYFSLEEGTDTITEMPSKLLDGAGWDIKKFLRHIYRSNAVLFEWLHSPIIYRQDDTFVKDLRAMALNYFNPKRVIHHYLGIATGMWKREFSGEAVKIKKYFYVLRPILAAKWVAEYKSPPPVEFDRLLPLVNTPHVLLEIKSLLVKKANAEEGELIARNTIIDTYLQTEMKALEIVAKAEEKEKNSLALIDQFYKTWVLKIKE